MRQHGVFAQPLGQMMRHALRQPPRVDEHQRGAIGADQLGHAVVDLVPHLVAWPPAPSSSRGTSTARSMARRWPTSMTCASVAQKRRHFFDAVSRWRKARCAAARVAALLHQPVEARQRQRQMRAALIVGHGVNFVHDHGARRLPASRAASPAVSRMKSDSGVVTRMCGAFARHALALGLRRIAGAHRGADGRELDAALARPARRSRPAELPDSCERRCSAL